MASDPQLVTRVSIQAPGTSREPCAFKGALVPGQKLLGRSNEVAGNVDNTNPQKRRARVLQLAYACSPWRGSEPGVGWNRAVEAAKYCDVWVICEGVEFEHQVLGHLDDTGPIEGLQFRFVRKTRLEQFVSRIPGIYYLAYRNWHRRAFRLASALHQELDFDLSHQVTLCGYREPGELSNLPIPFVWGPVGGTQNHPWITLRQAGLWGGIQETVRSVANSLQLRFSRRIRRAARRASLVLVANSTNQADFERVLGKRAPVFCETGSPYFAADENSERTPRSSTDRPLRLMWAGNLHAFKALPLLLQAISLLPTACATQLRIVGAGPQQLRWQRLADRWGVADRIEWIGHVPDREMQKQYKWADVFVFTSLRDTSGNVIFEALASGIPVLAADHQGVGDIVTNECGIKITVDTPREMAKQYRDAIIALAEDPTRREQLSAGALRRAAEYAWPEQGKRMRDYYRQVLGNEFFWEQRVDNKQPNTTEQPA